MPLSPHQVNPARERERERERDERGFIQKAIYRPVQSEGHQHEHDKISILHTNIHAYTVLPLF